MCNSFFPYLVIGQETCLFNFTELQLVVFLTIGHLAFIAKYGTLQVFHSGHIDTIYNGYI